MCGGLKKNGPHRLICVCLHVRHGVVSMGIRGWPVGGSWHFLPFHWRLNSDCMASMTDKKLYPLSNPVSSIAFSKNYIYLFIYVHTFIFFFKLHLGWRDGSGVKGTGCTSRGPGFCSQHLHSSLQLTDSSSRGSDAQCGNQILIWYIYIYVSKHIYIETFFKLKKNQP